MLVSLLPELLWVVHSFFNVLRNYNVLNIVSYDTNFLCIQPNLFSNADFFLKFDHRLQKFQKSVLLQFPKTMETDWTQYLRSHISRPPWNYLLLTAPPFTLFSGEHKDKRKWRVIEHKPLRQIAWKDDGKREGRLHAKKLW